MIVNFEVAFAAYFKIEQAMLRKQFEHMIEERQTGADARTAITVEAKFDAHICFFRLPLDLRLSFGYFHRFNFLHRSLNLSECASSDGA